MPANAIPVILDTDIGSDIDDAVALAYLLRQPRCELLGVTCVSGDQPNRARLASAICHAAGRPEVPICCGAEASLLRGVTQPNVPQARLLDQLAHGTAPPPGEAVSWLRDTIRARPGEIVLLSIGPLTNIGLLLAGDPGVADLLAGHYLMGGRYLPGSPAGQLIEWNCRCDPEAARICFDRGPAEVRAVGADVTSQCTLAADEVRERFRGPLLGVVRQLADVWFEHTGRIVFHDPLAAACIFEPELCQWQRGRVTVDRGSDVFAGGTLFRPAADGPHHVAVSVDSARFFDHYFATVGP